MNDEYVSCEDLPLAVCVDCGVLGHTPDGYPEPRCFSCQWWRDYQQGRAALDLAPAAFTTWDRHLVRLIEGSVGCLLFLALAIGPTLVH
jgi:hypothetical protein